MTDGPTAETIFSQVRVFYNLKDPFGYAPRRYTGGDVLVNPKSANKDYDPEAVYTDEMQKKVAVRNSMVEKSYLLKTAADAKFEEANDKFFMDNPKAEYNPAADPAVIGKAISKTVDGERFGNCGEMAQLSVYYAKLLKQEALVLQVGSISVFEDIVEHAFCVVGTSTEPSWESMNAIAGQTTKGIWIVDPWANICCEAGRYAEQFKIRMLKWRSNHKRVNTACGMRVLTEQNVERFLNTKPGYNRNSK